jgi:hypothetical protein
VEVVVTAGFAIVLLSYCSHPEVCVLYLVRFPALFSYTIHAGGARALRRSRLRTFDLISPYPLFPTASKPDFHLPQLHSQAPRVYIPQAPFTQGPVNANAHIPRAPHSQAPDDASASARLSTISRLPPLSGCYCLYDVVLCKLAAL